MVTVPDSAHLYENVSGLTGGLAAGLMHHDSRVGKRVPHSLHKNINECSVRGLQPSLIRFGVRPGTGSGI